MLKMIGLALCLHLALAVSARADECGARRDQIDMNQCASAAFHKADALLNARYKKIVACLRDKAAPLVEAQRAWTKFRDAECKFRGSASEGGSIQPMVVGECLTSVTEARTKGLDFYMTCEEGDAACPTWQCGFGKAGR